ncbi:hypothetical protein LF1_35510 [Rubripirellula obstinata]|uniref:Uncharacterized protein n=1 Tax=Rubripirellula obstinata TaxID=406547 RepID=A0A5B1CML1_9BACT|nr:hypothetical protein LF1_35510 [Rubripirellula obstinata]
MTFGMGVPLGISLGISVSPEAVVIDNHGCRYAACCRVLSRRTDGSPMWILVQTCLGAKANAETEYTLSFESGNSTGAQALAARPTTQHQPRDHAISLAHLHQKLAGWNVRLVVCSAGGNRWQLPLSVNELELITDEQPKSSSAVLSKRYATKLDGTSIRVEFSLTYFVDSSSLRIDATLHNPNRAEHSDGFWDLGDPMSYCLESAMLSIENDDSVFSDIRWQTDRDQPVKERSSQKRLQLFQHHSGGHHSGGHHSGGLNAERRNHRRSDGNPPELGPSRHEDRRFQPIVTLQGESSSVTATMIDFWQKFPSSIEADERGFHFGLLAQSNAGPQELQGGEKTTRTIWMSLGDDSQQRTNADDPIHRLDWVHRPVTILQDPQELADSESLDWFTANRELPNPKLQTLFEELLQGENSFFNKREAIDEYGWRNFGDVWADHEEAYSQDPKPVISHYNNQYDLLQGFLRRYLHSGDRRWWDLARPLADHVMDIDIYHTDQDRAAYNGGMFWHTSHYRDAGTCTHRTFSHSMTGDEHRVNGGGPSNEHNYTSGLLLYHHLTGCPRAAATVCSLADWVIAMDDGDRSPLAPLSDRATGYASSTSQSTFHGPGRGLANSINALMDAWTLTRSEHYLEKCEALIYRSIHPSQNFDEMELLNAELRWSYPVALQALLRFVQLVSSDRDETTRYILAALHRYGAWMQSKEKHFLDRPDELEFPTETWAAQDLRKGTTMMMIARYQPESESSDALYQDGKAFFDRALDQLFDSPTRSYTRPAAILLQQVPVLMAAMEPSVSQHAASVVNGDLDGPWPAADSWEFQKAEIRRSVRSPLQFLRLAFRIAGVHRWPLALAESPIGQWWRTRFRRTNSR